MLAQSPRDACTWVLGAGLWNSRWMLRTLGFGVNRGLRRMKKMEEEIEMEKILGFEDSHPLVSHQTPFCRGEERT